MNGQGPLKYNDQWDLDKLIANLELQQVKAPNAVPVALQERLGVENVIKPEAVGGLNVTPMQGLAAAQVVAGLLGGIMKAKQATKERKAKAVENEANRNISISQFGTQMQNNALQSLMNKLK